MRSSLALLVSLCFGASGILFATPVDKVLTNIAQIRSLSAISAAQAFPVRLRGVVLDESQPREHAVILADENASVYLFATSNLFARYHPKDSLEIAGVTSKGEFAPCVHVTSVTTLELGTGTIPTPRPTTYQELITGSLDAQFVEITGVVRQTFQASAGDETWRLTLAANGGVIPIRVPLPQDSQVEPDAEVTVQAVCLYQFNNKRQALSPVLQVPHGKRIRVLKPAPENPFAAPLQPLDSLLQFSPEIPFGHRIHVHGIVTLCQVDSSVWIHDESAGLRIQTQEPASLEPGDEIEVLGFPGYAASTPVLEDAICKKVGKSTPPAPLAITNFAAAYDHQDDLVSIEATLTEIQPIMNGLALTLEHDNTVFKSILKFPLHPNVQPGWQIGSRVRAAGICDVIYDYNKPVMGVWHPQSIQLLMRSPGDLTILKAPSWWTAGHIIVVLSLFAGGLLFVSIIAAWFARHRLAEQAHNHEMAEAEFTAVLAERNRLAREIHDTLAQGFTSTLVQLQLVKVHVDDENNAVKHHLDQAEQTIRDSLSEARKSIWKMRSQVLEAETLANALKHLLTQMSDHSVPETHFEVLGEERRLSPNIENNVLRLGQEAIANAIRHARAKTINVRIEFREESLSLLVSDDGQGFDATNPPSSEGGFGLIGMQERAALLSGELKIRSAPEKGTEVYLHIPLSGQSTRTSK